MVSNSSLLSSQMEEIMRRNLHSAPSRRRFLECITQTGVQVRDARLLMILLSGQDSRSMFRIFSRHTRMIAVFYIGAYAMNRKT